MFYSTFFSGEMGAAAAAAASIAGGGGVGDSSIASSAPGSAIGFNLNYTPPSSSSSSSSSSASSSVPQFKRERAWMLRVLAEGAQTPADAPLLMRRHVLPLVMSFVDSPLSDAYTRAVALQVSLSSLLSSPLLSSPLLSFPLLSSPLLSSHLTHVCLNSPSRSSPGAQASTAGCAAGEET